MTFHETAEVGTRVRALGTIYDLPGNPDPGPIHAHAGDEGTVVHAQKGLFPTVRFDRTGGATCVTGLEVEIIDHDSNVYAHPRLRRFTDWVWRGVTYVVATPKRIWGAVRYGGNVLI